MIISEKQIMQLIYLLQDAIKTIIIAAAVIPKLGSDIVSQSENLLVSISNQQSEELKNYGKD